MKESHASWTSFFLQSHFAWPTHVSMYKLTLRIKQVNRNPTDATLKYFKGKPLNAIKPSTSLRFKSPRKPSSFRQGQMNICSHTGSTHSHACTTFWGPSPCLLCLLLFTEFHPFLFTCVGVDLWPFTSSSPLFFWTLEALWSRLSPSLCRTEPWLWLSGQVVLLQLLGDTVQYMDSLTRALSIKKQGPSLVLFSLTS